MELDLGFAAQACMIVMTASAIGLMALERYLERRFGDDLPQRA